MPKTQRLLFGTLLLTAAGLISRLIGFFYRIFLSHAIGAEGMGIFQLISPIFNLCYAFTVLGVQTALSKSVAARLATGNKKGARDLFIVGSAISFCASLLAFMAVYFGCDWFCNVILAEPRCIPLVRLMSFTIPFGTLHICITSYYFAQKKTVIPSIEQMLEQCVRVMSSWVFFRLMLANGIPASPFLAVAGTAVSELFAFFFIFHFLRKEFKEEGYHIRQVSSVRVYASEILRLSLPLTANRVILNLLRSVETVLIPFCLRLYGLTSGEALSTYGVLTGMALPLILFPSTITHSVSVMLLPAVAESKARNQKDRIAFTVEKTIRYGLFLGILCFGLFYRYGDSLGALLFHSEEAGRYIAILSFICPFMYLSTTLASIINGLGKTTLYFIQSLAGLLLRICFVFFAIPRFGILGYLWGVLANEIILVLLSVISLHREGVLVFHAADAIAKPLCFLMISAGCAQSLQLISAYLPGGPLILLVASCAVLTLVYVLLLNTFHLIHLPNLIRKSHE
ncbi:polysaccharide biosynthesis protein [Ruminococcus sp. OA3]|uniref:polysaccharide biosynthesis protein n=1 Tax=Ruminococcus sp. OA3 TaxID=2914164 RepID=UPI001F06A7C2|nr:polysaccharide biosynthesis protein [Ruminococcus sp. OA3]MCH1983071.1 polysaccharide biosynthesis protein [Ruminococcus sp. OA3]